MYMYAIVYLLKGLNIFFLGGGGLFYILYMYDKHYTTSTALLLALFW